MRFAQGPESGIVREGTALAPAPSNVVVILLDSLNRHMLGAYGSDEFDTPNLDRLARRAIRFDKHYAGALPCIPARHDLLCGSWDFLWRPWGSIELWERPLTYWLRKKGIPSKLVTDHPHLFETGGENYHTDFMAWDYLRGHESDPWRTRPDPSWMGAPMSKAGAALYPYDRSRGWFRGEDDFPGPRTMQAAARWLDEEARFHDRFFLLIDEFDPHEPFDTPEPYASMYDPSWQGPHLVWPPYSKATLANGTLTPTQARQVRASYGGKLTMIDRWLGVVLDALDRNAMWASTAVFLITDHGHYLGEKDLFGKPAAPLYEPIGHIPLLVAWPGEEARACNALTTTVDVHATILDIFDVEARGGNGRSLVPIIDGRGTAIREHVLAGVWGREVHVIDERSKYVRAPATENNVPLSLWSNRWSTMPIPWLPDVRLPDPDDRAVLERAPGTRVPVIRQPFAAGDMLPFWARGGFTGNHLFDLHDDPTEEHNLAGDRREGEMEERLRCALLEVDAPSDQLERLGLA